MTVVWYRILTLFLLALYALRSTKYFSALLIDVDSVCFL